MPFFMVYSLIEKLSDKAPEPNRAEVLDAMRARKERFGW